MRRASVVAIRRLTLEHGHQIDGKPSLHFRCSDDSLQTGLLFRCNLGRVDLDNPVGARFFKPSNIQFYDLLVLAQSRTLCTGIISLCTTIPSTSNLRLGTGSVSFRLRGSDSMLQTLVKWHKLVYINMCNLLYEQRNVAFSDLLQQ